jgi:hypothetical protein
MLADNRLNERFFLPRLADLSILPLIGVPNE